MSPVSGQSRGGDYIEYDIHLHDIHKGNVESDPYTGEDHILVYKEGYDLRIISRKPEQNTMGSGSEQNALVEMSHILKNAYQKIEENLKNTKGQNLGVRIGMIRGALSVLEYAGAIDKNEKDRLWYDFIMNGMDMSWRQERGNYGQSRKS